MRFKDFTWPHNPETCTVAFRRRLAVHPAPFGHCVLQELGSGYRVLRGEGVFAGEDAYRQFRMLAEVFRQEGPGLLVHPVWQTERAYFASLEVAEEPTPDFVRYRFEFWEDWNGFDAGLQEVRLPSNGGAGGGAGASGGGQKNVHTVVKGDTLWGIARRYGTDLNALIRANPQIKNPNLIYPGNEVVLP